MEGILQAQEARILQLEAQNRTDADQRERERLQLVSDFKSEIDVLRARIGTEPAASVGSRPPDLESRLVDTRVIGKPDMFFGEREKWKDWSMVLKAYMMAVNPEYVGAFERLDNADVTLHNASVSPGSSKLSLQLYYVLVMLSRAKAQDKLNVVGRGEGFTAWQRFLADYDPKIRTRRVGLLIQSRCCNTAGTP